MDTVPEETLRLLVALVESPPRSERGVVREWLIEQLDFDRAIPPLSLALLRERALRDHVWWISAERELSRLREEGLVESLRYSHPSVRLTRR